MPEIPIVDVNGNDFLSFIDGDIRGNGFEDMPYQIDNKSNFPTRVRLINSENYIEFHDIKFHGFGLIDSSNVSFINCSINSITLQRCENLRLKNCTILNLRLMNARGSHFKDCKINVIDNFSSSGNIFVNCEIGNPHALKKDFLESNEFTKIILYLMLFLIATLFPDIYFSIIYWDNYFSIIAISVGIVVLAAIYLSIKRGGKKYEKRPNIII